MKPSKILLFFALVFLGLYLIMLLFPQKGISIGKDISLTFVTPQEFFFETEQKQIDSSLLSIMDADIDLEEDDVDSLQISQNQYSSLDSAVVDDKVVYFEPHRISIDSIRQPLELPPSGIECLENFFAALCSKDEITKGIHILHYGDSQIETDRMTSYIRTKLQKQFGGIGPGLLAARPPYDYPTPMRAEFSESWNRYVIFPHKDTLVPHNKYGALAAFCTFGPLKLPKKQVVKDTLDSLDVDFGMKEMLTLPQEEVRTVYKGDVKFTNSSVSSSSTRQFSKVRLFYGNTDKNFKTDISIDGNPIFSDSISKCETYTVKTFHLPSIPSKDISFSFASEQSPEFYAFSFEGNSGVNVDNIPLRGCSGTIFTQMSSAFLAQMYKDLNAKLLILQFGGNAVPSLSADRVSYFSKLFESQLRLLRKTFPNMSIIVIGPADMSVKDKDTYVTYESLEPLVDALRNSAFKYNCAFWDMYTAMGGQNSMPQWVFHEPALAEKDFIHLTPRGANIMAQMFYSSLMSKFNQYISKK